MRNERNEIVMNENENENEKKMSENKAFLLQKNL